MCIHIILIKGKAYRVKIFLSLTPCIKHYNTEIMVIWLDKYIHCVPEKRANITQMNICFSCGKICICLKIKGIMNHTYNISYKSIDFWLMHWTFCNWATNGWLRNKQCLEILNSRLRLIRKMVLRKTENCRTI